MRRQASPQVSLLHEIENRFASLRQESGRRRVRVTPELRRLIDRAIHSGVTRQAVALAAKVSPNTITKWLQPRADSSAGLVRELHLVPAQQGRNSHEVPSAATATIHLGAHARVVLGVDAITPSLLAMLINAGGGL